MQNLNLQNMSMKSFRKFFLYLHYFFLPFKDFLINISEKYSNHDIETFVIDFTSDFIK